MSSMGPLLEPAPGDADAMLAGIANKRRRRRNRRIALSVLALAGLLLFWVRWARAPRALDPRGFEQVAVVSGHGGELLGPDGFRLVLPEQGLEAPIEVRWTTVRTPEELASVPGQLATVLEGNTTALQSYGMVHVELEVAGAPHELVGQARIEVPLHEAHEFDEGDAVALYHLDQDEEIWTLDGEGAVENGRLVAEVGHFSWWNAAAPTTLAGCLCGTVEGGEAAVMVLGQEHLVRASARTVDGAFCVQLLAEEPVEVRAYGEGASCRSARRAAVVGQPGEPYPGLGCSEVALQLQTCTDEAPLPTAPEPVDVVRLYVMSEQTEGRAICGSKTLPFSVEWSVAGFVAPVGRPCSIEIGGREVGTYRTRQGVHRLYCDDAHCEPRPLSARVNPPPPEAPVNPEPTGREDAFDIGLPRSAVEPCGRGSRRDQGPIVFRFQVQPDGRLTGLSEQKRTGADDRVVECVYNVLAGWVVGEPPSSPTTSLYRVDFRAGEPETRRPAPVETPPGDPGMPESEAAHCFEGRGVDMGPVSFDYMLQPSGAVAGVELTEDSGAPPSVVRCVQDALQAWRAPLRPEKPTARSFSAVFVASPSVGGVSYQLVDVMLRNNEGVKKCFYQHNQATGVLPDRVDVRFRLDRDGSVGPVSMEQPAVSGTALATCLDRAIRAVPFPASSGTGQVIQYPFVLRGVPGHRAPDMDGEGVSDELVRLYISNSMRVQACIDEVFAATGAIPSDLQAELRIAPNGATRLLETQVIGASTPNLQACLGEALATIHFPERSIETLAKHSFTLREPRRPLPAPAPVPVPGEPLAAPAPELRFLSTGLVGRIRSDRAVKACLVASRASEGVLVEARLVEGDDRARFSVVDEVPDALKACLGDAVRRLRFDDGPRYEIFLLEL